MKSYKKLTINPAEQGSFEWKVSRLGMITGTRLANLMKAGRGKDNIFGDTAYTQMAEISGERYLEDEIFTNEDAFDEYARYQGGTNKYCEFGNEYEDVARSLYMLQTGYDVTQCGQVIDDECALFAISPDGLILNKKGQVEGTIEIKCPPTIQTSMRYKWFIHDAESLKAEKPEYYWQIMAGLTVTDAKWCDFIVYSAWTKEKLYIVRIERDEDVCAQIRERVKQVEEEINKLNSNVYKA